MAINRRFQLFDNVYLTLPLSPSKKPSFNSTNATPCLPHVFLHLSLYCQVIFVCTFVVAPLTFQEGWHSVLLSSPQFVHHQLLVMFEYLCRLENIGGFGKYCITSTMSERTSLCVLEMINSLLLTFCRDSLMFL